jgi:outer membrane protein TolC/predicted MFS family arabinose efflux permease
MTRYQWLVLFAAWLGWGFDVFDGLLFNYVAPICVPNLLGLDPGDPASRGVTMFWTGALTSLLLLGWALGGVLFGMVTDRLGRTRTLLLTMLTYSLATAACAFAPNIAVLALCRFVASLGIGGEWAAGASLVAEVLPPHRKVLGGALLYTSAPMGMFLATFVTDLFTKQLDGIAGDPSLSWRAVFLTGLIPSAVALAVRMFIKEPEGWHPQLNVRLAELFTPEFRARTLGGLGLATIALVTWWSCSAFIPLVARSLVESVRPPVGPTELASTRASFITIATSAFNLGGLVGTLLTVPVALHMGRRPMFITYFLASTAAIAFVFGAPMEAYTRLYAMFFVGLTVFGVFWILHLLPSRTFPNATEGNWRWLLLQQRARAHGGVSIFGGSSGCERSPAFRDHPLGRGCAGSGSPSRLGWDGARNKNCVELRFIVESLASQCFGWYAHPVRTPLHARNLVPAMLVALAVPLVGAFAVAQPAVGPAVQPAAQPAGPSTPPMSASPEVKLWDPSAVLAAAGNDSAGIVAREELLRYLEGTLKSNPRVEQLRAATKGAKAGTLAGNAGFLPHIVVSGAYTRHQYGAEMKNPDFSKLGEVSAAAAQNPDPAASSPGAILGSLPTKTITIVPENQWDASLSITQPIFDARAFTRLRSVRSDWKAAALQETREQNRILMATAQNYLLASLGRGLVASAQTSLNATAALKSRLDANYAVGRVSGVMVQRVAAELARAKMALVQAESEAKAALRQLTSLSGIAEAPRATDSILITLPSISSDIEANAVASHPQVLAAKERGKSARAMKDEGKWAYAPVLGARFIERISNAKGFVGKTAQWDVGVFANWTLFDALIREAIMKGAEARDAAARAELRATIQEASDALINAKEQLALAQSGREAAHQAAVAMDESLRMSMAQLDVGGHCDCGSCFDRAGCLCCAGECAALRWDGHHGYVGAL